MWPFTHKPPSIEQVVAWVRENDRRKALMIPYEPRAQPSRHSMTTDQVADALAKRPHAAYICMCITRFPGRRGFIHLKNLAEAINKGEVPPP